MTLLIVLKMVLMTISLWFWVIVVASIRIGGSLSSANLIIPSITTSVLYYLP